MKKFAFLPIDALVFASACDARPDQQQQGIKSEEISGPSFSASSDDALAGKSSICVAYINGRDALSAEVQQGNAGADAAAKLEMLDDYIANSCN